MECFRRWTLNHWDWPKWSYQKVGVWGVTVLPISLSSPIFFFCLQPQGQVSEKNLLVSRFHSFIFSISNQIGQRSTYFLVVPFMPPLHQLSGKVLTFTPCSAFSQLNNSFPSNKTYGQIFPCFAFLLHICCRVSSLVNYAYE